MTVDEPKAVPASNLEARSHIAAYVFGPYLSFHILNRVISTCSVRLLSLALALAPWPLCRWNRKPASPHYHTIMTSVIPPYTPSTNPSSYCPLEPEPATARHVYALEHDNADPTERLPRRMTDRGRS